MHYMYFVCMIDRDHQPDLELLNQRLAAAGLTQTRIADALGASQSQVSRLLSGTAKRRSKLFNKLCIYAQSLVSSPGQTAQSRKDLLNTVCDMWDGSAEHAAALSEAFRAIAALKAFECGQR
jgi:transcriptional regulator with XRE-family HTH domain